MTDAEKREKVIKALEWCIDKPCMPNCPYFNQQDESQAYCLFRKILPDALALLKEQEAKTAWYDSNDILRYWHCGHCGVIITHGDKYCRMCGCEVKWEPPKEEDQT